MQTETTTAAEELDRARFVLVGIIYGRTEGGLYGQLKPEQYVTALLNATDAFLSALKEIGK